MERSVEEYRILEIPYNNDECYGTERSPKNAWLQFINYIINHHKLKFQSMDPYKEKLKKNFCNGYEIFET